jgi:hypothetical protein
MSITSILSGHTSTLDRRPGIVAAPARKALWAGRILSGLAAAFLAFDAVIKVAGASFARESMAQLGWPEEVLFGLGVAQLVCLALYLLPRTSLLGALLWTGFLGGAIATHLRLGNPWFSHVLFPTYVGAFLWLGLWLRDPDVRAVLPWPRRLSSPAR